MIVSGSSGAVQQDPGRESTDPFAGAPAPGVSMRIVRVAGTRRSPHRHPHSPELIYVVTGSGVLWEDGVSHRFEAGDSALIESGVPHATVPDPGTSMKLVCFFPHSDLSANIEELEHVVIDGPEGRRRP